MFGGEKPVWASGKVWCTVIQILSPTLLLKSNSLSSSVIPLYRNPSHPLPKLSSEQFVCFNHSFLEYGVALTDCPVFCPPSPVHPPQDLQEDFSKTQMWLCYDPSTAPAGSGPSFPIPARPLTCTILLAFASAWNMLLPCPLSELLVGGPNQISSLTSLPQPSSHTPPQS